MRLVPSFCRVVAASILVATVSAFAGDRLPDFENDPSVRTMLWGSCDSGRVRYGMYISESERDGVRYTVMPIVFADGTVFYDVVEGPSWRIYARRGASATVPFDTQYFFPFLARARAPQFFKMVTEGVFDGCPLFTPDR